MKRLFFLPSTKCHNLGLDFVLNVIKILRNDSVSKDYIHNSLFNISKEMCKTDKENVEGTLENETTTMRFTTTISTTNSFLLTTESVTTNRDCNYKKSRSRDDNWIFRSTSFT